MPFASRCGRLAFGAVRITFLFFFASDLALCLWVHVSQSWRISSEKDAYFFGIVRFAVRCLCWQIMIFVAQLMLLHPFFAFFIWITICANIRSPYFPRSFLRAGQSPQNVGEHSLGYMPNGPTIDYRLSAALMALPSVLLAALMALPHPLSRLPTFGLCCAGTPLKPRWRRPVIITILTPLSLGVRCHIIAIR